MTATIVLIALGGLPDAAIQQLTASEPVLMVLSGAALLALATLLKRQPRASLADSDGLEPARR